MLIDYTCECGKSYQIPDEIVGKKIKCSHCDKRFIVTLTTPPSSINPPHDHEDIRQHDKAPWLPPGREDLPQKIARFIDPNEDIVFAVNPSKLTLYASAVLYAFFPAVLCVLTFGLMLSGASSNTAAMALWGVIWLSVSALLVICAYWSWKNTFYIVTSSRTILQRGILNINVEIVPNANIQQISVNTGLIDRLLGLNTVVIHNATGAHPFSFLKGALALRYLSNVDEVVRFYGRFYSNREA